MISENTDFTENPSTYLDSNLNPRLLAAHTSIPPIFPSFPPPSVSIFSSSHTRFSNISRSTAAPSLAAQTKRALIPSFLLARRSTCHTLPLLLRRFLPIHPLASIRVLYSCDTASKKETDDDDERERDSSPRNSFQESRIAVTTLGDLHSWTCSASRFKCPAAAPFFLRARVQVGR